MARSRGRAAGRPDPDRTGWQRYATARAVDVLFRSAMLGMAAISLAIIVCGYVLGDRSWLPRLIFVGALLAVLGLGLLGVQWLILSEYRWTVRVTVNRPWYRFVAWIVVLLFAWAFGMWGAARGAVQNPWELVPSTIAAIGTVIAGLAAWRGARRTGGNETRSTDAHIQPPAGPHPEPVAALAEAIRQRPTEGAEVLFRTLAAEELKNLAVLLDNGMISRREFDELKESLLAPERLAQVAEKNLWAEFDEFLRSRIPPGQ